MIFMQTHSDYSNWFIRFKKSEEYKIFAEHPVAYFCAEYALDSSLPIYAGGLGVLAGDFVRETAQQKFPLVAVGLFYKKAQSTLSSEDEKKKKNIQPMLDKDNREIIVSLPIEDRIVSIKAWRWSEGSTSVYLLDADVPENDPRDRTLTHSLYDENRDVRLKQEIILGIGGFRLLARLGYHASVYHLNEGHSAFLALELVRHEMEHQRVGFDEACGYAKKHILFTNHTLVPEGQEQFASERIVLFMAKYAEEMGIKGEDIAQLGTLANNPNVFSMTNLSFRLSTKTSAVSKFHAEKAKDVWPEHPMESITNGIFVKRWEKTGGWIKTSLYRSHLKNKKKLLALVKKYEMIDWKDTDLILVWARRMVEYKRPLLLLEDTDRLLKIIKNSPVPVRLVFSGPTGEQENIFVVKVKQIIEEKLKNIAVFVPNYSTEIAEILTAGADVWLNTPIPGTEACGTSGMKAGVNGVPSLSTKDGWVHEVDAMHIGWVAESSTREEIFSLLEKNIIPLYCDHLKKVSGSAWAEKMKTVRNMILGDFSTSRVLREYIEKLYIPVMRQKHTHRVD